MKVYLVLAVCVVFASAKEWWESAVFYQIYPQSFKDSNDDGNGDLQGIIQKIDYLKELGIDGIWMNPIFASPMKDGGYDVSDYKSINQMFGNSSDFENLLRRAHELDIKVILDFVPNHTSEQHHWFQEAMKFNFKYLFYYVFREEENVPNNWVGKTNVIYVTFYLKARNMALCLQKYDRKKDICVCNIISLYQKIMG